MGKKDITIGEEKVGKWQSGGGCGALYIVFQRGGGVGLMEGKKCVK